MIGSNILSFEKLTSTNTYATDLLKVEMVPEGTVIRALFQTSGRGQAGNGWESEAGKNLLISIILYPTFIPPSSQFLISMVISLGISDFLSKELKGCRIKWPNDIYVKNDKIAGILIENSVMEGKLVSSVAGIGLNINQKKFTGNAPNPVSMSLVTGKEHDPDKCLSDLSGYIGKRYSSLRKGDYDLIRADYRSRLYKINEWSSFSAQETSFTGRILSVSDEGMLIIEHREGRKKEYAFKEIEFTH